MQDTMCGSPEQLLEAAERAKAALTIEKLFGGVLAGLCGEKGLVSSGKWVRIGLCVAMVSVLG